MIIKQCNEDTKHSDLLLACRPKKNDRARKTDLWLTSGHFLSNLARWLAWEADSNYPFGIIRENESDLWVEIDIASRNIHNSLWAICATLNAQQRLDNNIFGVLFKGWMSISFRALVFLISDCGSIAQIKTRLLNGAYGWINTDSVHMRDILNPFYTEVLEYGRVSSGQHNVSYISRSLWTYLNPPRTPPIGATAAAIDQLDTRRQMHAFMNTGFHRSRNADKALQKS
jgi:hypothetical protein